MESLRTRCQLVTGVFVMIMLASAVAALSDLSLVRYVQDLESGGPLDEAEAEQIDARQSMIGLVQVGLFITCAIVFLMWFHRAHKNLKAGGLNDLKYTPGWAVGGFFVPILNLVRPYQVMKEVWTGSEHLSGDDWANPWKADSPAPLVGWWWALLLISTCIDRASFRLTLLADDIWEFLTAAQVTLAADLMNIPAAFLALLMVRRITDLQDRAMTHFHANE